MLKYPPCFSCASAASIPAVPTETTSFYDTSLGIASVTWSRSLFGLSVVANLQLFASPAAEKEMEGQFGTKVSQESNFRRPNSQKAELNQTDPQSPSDHLRFRVFLPLPFRRKGSKILRSKTSLGRCCRVDLAWDLSRATFSRAGGPEPLAGFFFAIAIDGGILLLAGDRPNEASLRIKSAPPKNGTIATDPVSRRLDVKLREIGRDPSWAATARFAGKERELLITFDLEKKRMKLTVNGARVLHVRRLRWNFRGSEMVEMEGGDRVHVSWDLFRFLYRGESGGKKLGEDGDAVILLRFESGEERHFRKREGVFWKSADWSEESSRSWTTGTSSQSVEEWEGLEHAESFTLVICARRR